MSCSRRNPTYRSFPSVPPSSAPELAQRRATLQRHLLQQAGGSVGVFALCTFIWLSSGANGQFWPMWVALVAVIALARNAWRLYGPAPELDTVEAEVTRRNRARDRAHAAAQRAPGWRPQWRSGAVRARRS